MTDESKRVTARPMNDRLLVKVMDKQKGSIVPKPMVFGLGQLVSGITGQPEQPDDQPDDPDVEPARGVVVSVGPGYVVAGPDARYYVALDVKLGDEILFFEERGMKLTINGEELLLLHEQYVLVVLDSMDGDPARSDVDGGFRRAGEDD